MTACPRWSKPDHLALKCGEAEMEKCRACGSGESEIASSCSGERQSSTLSADVSGDGDGDGFSSETPSFRRGDDELEIGMGTGTTSEGSSPLGWPLGRSDTSNSGSSTAPLPLTGGRDTVIWEERSDKLYNDLSEVELMKERFAKLLLGEDMSGGGKGVCTALAISNAITNLSASVFGELWRLEPLSSQKKSMWHREMEWLLCVSDSIVELIPTWQELPEGASLEVMVSRPRSDLCINLPALKKLDAMLLETLDGFSDTEFWYVDRGILFGDVNDNGRVPLRLPSQRQEEKWWLPTPKVPPDGLSDCARKQLQHHRECTNQILKAAMAINNQVLSEMEVPNSYIETLPKNGKASLGDIMYRYITAEQFSPDCLLDCLDLSSEHHILEIVNRIEGAIHVWKQKLHSKHTNSGRDNRSTSKSSWGKMKDFVGDVERRELLAERAESLLLTLKLRFPGLSQTILDMNKIQYNKDVGQAILESYSRVLESLAFNIIARIDDLIYVDDMSKRTAQREFSSIPPVSSRVTLPSHKMVYPQLSVHVPLTPYATPFATPNYSTTPLASPGRAPDSPYVNSRSNNAHSCSPQNRVLSHFLGAEKETSDNTRTNGYVGKSVLGEMSRAWSYTENLGIRRDFKSPPARD